MIQSCTLKLHGSFTIAYVYMFLKIVDLCAPLSPKLVGFAFALTCIHQPQLLPRSCPSSQVRSGAK